MASNFHCPFRHQIRIVDGIETATCGLLQRLLLEDFAGATGVCEVKRDACEACSRSLPVTSDLVGVPFASILNNACERKLSRGQAEGSIAKRLAKIAEITENAICDEGFTHKLAACDVVVWCERWTEKTDRSIESVLSQQQAETMVHIVFSARAEAKGVGEFEYRAKKYHRRYNVRIHRDSQADEPFQALHELAPRLRGEFIALQHAEAISSPTRVSVAVAELRRLGADFIGSPLKTPVGEYGGTGTIGKFFQETVAWPTLVFRRSTFIDLGGVAKRNGDADIELLHRAFASGVRLALLPWATVKIDEEWSPTALGDTPKYEKRFGTLRHHAIGFPADVVESDVVLPIYGQLHFVREAIESVIEQANSETILHLVDDQSPEDVRDLFRYWGSHPRVRLYRNEQNLGQYTSFNNVSRFFETDLVAVQDGDDISLPHRISVSGNLLRHSDADYFAATMQQFGASESLPNRRSRFPGGRSSAYFAMNPTACFRVSMFRSLGGYADYGVHERNRGGLDTEFMNRAFHSEKRFAISTSIVTRRRVHAEAATKRSDTGFGSPLRDQAMKETQRRGASMQSMRTDPRFFGGLGNHHHLTKRLKHFSD